MNIGGRVPLCLNTAGTLRCNHKHSQAATFFDMSSGISAEIHALTASGPVRADQCHNRPGRDFYRPIFHIDRALKTLDTGPILRGADILWREKKPDTIRETG
jgi:hypothetical protein